MRDGGLSADRLRRLHEVMPGYVARGEVPGLVTMIARRGEGHVDAVGAMADGSEEPMRRDTIFRISSMTKPITAVAAMICVEDCLLRLDEPVDRLLPELGDRRVLRRPEADLDDTVPAHRPITVRDLLGLKTEIIGVGAVNAPATALSFEAGQPVTTPTARTFADGIATREPLAEVIETIRRGAARFVKVAEDEMAHAMRVYFDDTHHVAEGAGAAPLAALLQERARMAGKTVGVVLSGGNIERARFSQVLAGSTPG